MQIPNAQATSLELNECCLVVLQEMTELMSELREIMRRNFASGAVSRLPPQRWCSGDSATIVAERWEKLFDDFSPKNLEKFDPSRVSASFNHREQLCDSQFAD